MNRNKHIVIADENGDFYCRVVNDVLNIKKEEQVCGCGCPCFVSDIETVQGHFVCCYEEEGMGADSALFPFVQGLDERLYKAYDYSAKAHAGQHRKGTPIPYFTHIIMTMNYLMQLTQDIEVLQAAILHDTVEDTSVTFEDIDRTFGARVAALVEAETENKRHGVPASQTWDIRKKETIEHLKNRPLDVKAIVLADKTANLESITREWRRRGDRVWEKFNQKDKRKQEWYFKSIRENLTEFNGTDVMKVFDEYIETLF